ncbi:MAG: DUF6364 family protein, partial [Balneolales bacterium]
MKISREYPNAATGRAGCSKRAQNSTCQELIFVDGYIIIRINNHYTYNLVMTKKNKKLTLYLDEEVIRQAKEYARRSGSSVSDMVEKYLSEKTGPGRNEQESEGPIPAEFATFYGVVRVPDDFDEK